MRLTGVPEGADGMLARAGEEHQPAASGETLYVPAGAKSSLDNLIYLGVVLY